MKGSKWALFVCGFVACLAVLLVAGWLADGSSVEAKVSPVEALPDREVYYPGTERLAPDEMRVTACGTGMPNARPKQAAACWLVELGNGLLLLFGVGVYPFLGAYLYWNVTHSAPGQAPVRSGLPSRTASSWAICACSGARPSRHSVACWAPLPLQPS